MRNAIKFLFVILIAAAVSYGVSHRQAQQAGVTPPAETAFDRVMRTGVLRCAYYVFPPVMIRDINSGQLSGMAVDLMNNMAEKAGLKIEWVEEINFSNWAPGLQAKRFDAVCTPMWPDVAQGRVALFGQPLFYAAIAPLVRADDDRFKTLADLNSPDVTFIGQDNTMLAGLTKEAFPKAKIELRPATMDGPTMVQDIVTRKADAILIDKNALLEYNKRNDIKLKMVSGDTPVKAQAFTLVTAQPEIQLHLFLNNAVNDLITMGSIDRLLNTWEQEPGLFLRAAETYRNNQ